jgi:hypothetical protein
MEALRNEFNAGVLYKQDVDLHDDEINLELNGKLDTPFTLPRRNYRMSQNYNCNWGERSFSHPRYSMLTKIYMRKSNREETHILSFQRNTER